MITSALRRPSLGCLGLVMTLSLSACVTEGDDWSRLGGNQHSYHLRGERTELEWSNDQVVEKESATLIAGVALSVLERGLRDDSERYTAGYSASTFASVDSESVSSGRLTLTRLVDRDQTAAEFKLYLRPSQYLRGENEESSDATSLPFQFFDLVLESAEIAKSKAKVSAWRSVPKIDATVALQIEGIWIAPNKSLQRRNLLTGGTYTAKELTLAADHATLFDDTILGILVIPTGTEVLLRINAAVTERDSSRPGDQIDAAASVLTQNRSAVTGTITGN